MKHTKKITTPGGFRLIRAFSAEHNARRLSKFVERLERGQDMRRWMDSMRLKRRFSTRLNSGSTR